MRVVGIASSPREGGNSERLLDRFLEGAAKCGAEITKLRASRLDIAPCRSCDQCHVDGTCAVDDDAQKVREQLVAADIIVLASPVYYAGLPSQAKALIDRCQPLWVRKYLLERTLPPTPGGHIRRRGVFLCTAGNPQVDFSPIRATAWIFFDILEADSWAELCVPGLEAPDSIVEHPAALEQAHELGRRAVDEPWE
jgi:putative NADPH-quinone reductase